MPSWLVKAALQGTLSRLPNPQRWNSVLQRRVTKNTARLKPEVLLRKWANAQQHLTYYREHSTAPVDRPTVLEIGTGWFPIVPIALVLEGAARVTSIDKVALFAEPGLRQVLAGIHEQLDSGGITIANDDRRALAEDLLPRTASMSVDAILEALDITPRISDARASGLPGASVDLFVSNNTFEHIPGPILRDILVEYRRLAADGGVGSHFIDLADHYAGFDRSISVYNFLQFSESRWRLFNNDLQYQNRLRVPEYAALHADASWDIVEQVDDRDMAAFANASVHPQFRSWSDEDLAVYQTWMVSRPA